MMGSATGEVGVGQRELSRLVGRWEGVSALASFRLCNWDEPEVISIVEGSDHPVACAIREYRDWQFAGRGTGTTRKL